MARYTDPAQLLAAQQHKLARVEANAKAMHLGMVRDIEKRVRVELLSGTTSTQELRNAGHPFARRRHSRRGFTREAMKGGMRLSSRGYGKGTRLATRGVGLAIPKLPINNQTGELIASAAILRIAQPSGGQDVRLAYRSPYAKFVLAEKGTRIMVARGYGAAKRRIDREENRRLQYAIRLMTLTVAAA